MPVSEVSTVASLIQNRFQLEGGTGVCGTTVLDNFSCGISIILNSNLPNAVFRILDGIKSYPPSSSMFSEPFPVSDRTFPMKVRSHCNGQL